MGGCASPPPPDAPPPNSDAPALSLSLCLGFSLSLSLSPWLIWPSLADHLPCLWDIYPLMHIITFWLKLSNDRDVSNWVIIVAYIIILPRNNRINIYILSLVWWRHGHSTIWANIFLWGSSMVFSHLHIEEFIEQTGQQMGPTLTLMFMQSP